MIRSGKLQHPIEFQRVTETVSASGRATQTWTTFAQGRAELRQASISEYLSNGIEADANSAVFLIRWVPGISTADRIIHAGKIWNIRAIAEIGRRRGLELRVMAAS